MRRCCFFLVGWSIVAFLTAGCHPAHWQRSEKGISGFIQIESATVEADISVNDQKVGRTPLSLPVSYFATTPLRITAVAVDHHDFRQDLLVELPPVPEKIIVLNFKSPGSPRPQSDGTDFGDHGKGGADKEPRIIEKTVIAEKFILPPVVLFDTDRYQVKDQYLQELEHFAAVMQKTRFNLAVIGFADERHSVAYNQVLSLNRARAVYNLLKQFGVPEERMSLEGRGELSTVDAIGRRFEWQHDRRVEIQLSEASQ